MDEGGSRSRVLWLTLLSAISVSFILGVMLIREKRLVRDLRNVIVGLNTRMTRLNTEREGLRSALFEMPLHGTFLSGREARSGAERRMVHPIDGVYYLLDVRCSGCAAVVPFLDSLATIAPGAVVGICYNDSAAVTTWSRDHGVNFPVIIHPSGTLISVIPRNATPLTVTVIDGRVQSLTVGAPSDGERRGLIASAESMRTPVGD